MEKIPETAADISPYATSNFQAGMSGSRGTLGRAETLRMTDYRGAGESRPRVSTSPRSLLTHTSLDGLQEPDPAWRAGGGGTLGRSLHTIGPIESNCITQCCL